MFFFKKIQNGKFDKMSVLNKIYYFLKKFAINKLDSVDLNINSE